MFRKSFEKRIEECLDRRREQEINEFLENRRFNDKVQDVVVSIISVKQNQEPDAQEIVEQYLQQLQPKMERDLYLKIRREMQNEKEQIRDEVLQEMNNSKATQDENEKLEQLKYAVSQEQKKNQKLEQRIQEQTENIEQLQTRLTKMSQDDQNLQRDVEQLKQKIGTFEQTQAVQKQDNVSEILQEQLKKQESRIRQLEQQLQNEMQSQQERTLLQENQQVLLSQIQKLVQINRKNEGRIQQLEQEVQTLRREKTVATETCTTVCTTQPQSMETVEPVPKHEVEQPEKKIEEELLFGENQRMNEMALKRFIAQLQPLKKAVSISLDAGKQQEVCLNLIEKCEDKFQKLLDASATRLCDAEELAEKALKILKNSIMPLTSKRKVYAAVNDYLSSCRVYRVPWEKGTKIEEDDYDYMSETIFHETVQDPEQNERILEIMQDAYVFYYDMDGEKEKAIIPGIYKIGQYK